MNIESYESWLVEKDHKTPGSAYTYKVAIPNIEEHYSKIKGVKVNFFDLEIKELEKVVEDYGLKGKYFEYGNKSKGTYRNAMNALLRYKKEQPKKAIDIKSLIEGAIALPYIQELINEHSFYFQKLLDVKDKFLKFQISKETVSNILNEFNEAEDITFEIFVENKKGIEREFLDILGEFISYLDAKASGKQRWNGYLDKRTIAQSGVRQNHWVNNLLQLKINPDFELQGSIKNAINYSISPMENLTVLSENHRELISKIILEKPYNSSSFCDDLIKFFNVFDITPKNRMNYSHIISAILYENKIDSLWNLKEKKMKKEKSTTKESLDTENLPLNQILFGAPGTGKTYTTKKIAIEIIDNQEYDENNRELILERYDELVKSNQIHFTTFHQSMSYEDFIEGIKPVLITVDDNDENHLTKESSISYENKDGIFKKLCQLAEGVTGKVEIVDDFDFQGKDFYKMSLGGKHSIEKHNWSIKNNLIFLGWGDDKDFTYLNKIKDWKVFRDIFQKDFPDLVSQSKYVIQAVFIFQKMKIGDIVIISKGNKIIDAIGIIESEYFFDDSKEIDNFQFRKVKWLSTNMNTTPDIFVNKGISQQTIYQFYNEDINIEAFNENFKRQPQNVQTKKYVIIIDEINRGNVSSIFGELITLLEEDKRKGNSEEIEVILPYSQKNFSVPNNLYIIGTMNTADRSVESLDTALRRRFSFVEMTSKPEKLIDVTLEDAEEIDMARMLDKINQRIELLIDKDHQIGHSFFINLKNFNGLRKAFKNKIIPLLEEYFFGDFGKIGLVLGENFVSIKNGNNNSGILAKFSAYEEVDFITEKKVYQIKNCEELMAQDFISIYE